MKVMAPVTSVQSVDVSNMTKGVIVISYAMTSKPISSFLVSATVDKIATLATEKTQRELLNGSENVGDLPTYLKPCIRRSLGRFLKEKNIKEREWIAFEHTGERTFIRRESPPDDVIEIVALPPYSTFLMVNLDGRVSAQRFWASNLDLLPDNEELIDPEKWYTTGEDENPLNTSFSTYQIIAQIV